MIDGQGLTTGENEYSRINNEPKKNEMRKSI